MSGARSAFTNSRDSGGRAGSRASDAEGGVAAQANTSVRVNRDIDPVLTMPPPVRPAETIGEADNVANDSAASQTAGVWSGGAGGETHETTCCAIKLRLRTFAKHAGW